MPQAFFHSNFPEVIIVQVVFQKSIFTFFKKILESVSIGGTKLMKGGEIYNLKNVSYSMVVSIKPMNMTGQVC